MTATTMSMPRCLLGIDDLSAGEFEALTSEQAANLLPVEQAVLRALVTGDWEV